MAKETKKEEKKPAQKKTAAGMKKPTGKATASKKTTSKSGSNQKKAKKSSKTQTPPKHRKKTVAEKAAAWKNGATPNLLRWLAMIPLGLAGYVFAFKLAGYSFSALVCLCLMGVLMFYNICYLARNRHPKLVRVVKRVFTFLLCLGLLVAGITECMIIYASLGDKQESCEYVLVLGAKVRPDGPSVSLMDRIRAAADYMEAHPGVTAIVSGGMGPDEPMTEARCMYEELVKLGVDSQRIWLEEEATSTWENLRFTLDMIEERTGQRPEKIGLLSSEYHLFRAKLFAQDSGVDAVGIPARTSRISQMINHFMREVAGVWHYILLGGQYND